MKVNSLKKSFARLSVLLLSLGAVGVSAAGLEVQQYNGKSYYITGAPVEIATWKYGALGVYTTIHDDWGSTSINGVYEHLDTINSNRGLQTSSCAIAGSCDDYFTTKGKEFIRHGHEIHSHSVTHTSASSGKEEIVNSKAILEAKMGVPVEFYVFPFDQWSDASKQYLREAGYVGARSGDRQPRIDAGNAGGYIPNMCNDANFPDAFELQFDVFPRTNSAYKNVPDNGDATAFLKRYISDAISSKGWAIQEFHDLSSSNSLSIPVDQYRSLLDSVARAKNKNEIWACGPTEVIRYRFAREFAGIPSLAPSTSGLTLTYGAPKDVAKLNKYHTPLTVIFRAPSMTANIKAVQSGIEIPSRKIADGYFALEADPIKGSVEITSAAKPYSVYPFQDAMDTTPSALPAWNNFTVYATSGTQVYHAGAEYRAQYWTQGNNPSNGAPWTKVKTVTEKVLNARASKGGKITPSGKQIVAAGTTQTYTISADAGYDIDYVNVNGVNVGSPTSWTFSNVSTHNTIEVICTPSVAPVGPTWTITSTATVGGSITPAGAAKVADKGTQNYAIAASVGNKLDSVVVNGTNKGAVASYSFTNVTADQSIAAYFSALPKITVTATATAGGTITPAGESLVISGESISYTIAATVGNRLDSVLVNGVNKGTVSTWGFTNVTSNQNIAAYFSAVPTYWMQTSGFGPGHVAPSTRITVTEGGTQVITVTPDVGARIDSILVNGSKVAIDTVITFTNVRDNYTIKGYFTAIPKYSITASATTGGTITPAGVVVVTEGGSQSFSAAASAGNVFKSLIVNSDTLTTASYTFTNVRAAATIKAVFEAVPVCTLTVTQTTGGTIAPSTKVVNKGASQTVTITPNAGYTIADVTVNGVSVGAVSSYSFTNMSASATITATYAIKTYAISATAGANGTITPAGSTNVNHGGSQAYTIKANTGYEIDKLTVNGAVVSSVATYTFTNVTAAQSINATFKLTVIGGGCADIKAWSANDHWTSYKVGDKRTDANKIWQCTSISYSFYQPSSVNGRYGWKQVGTCN